MTRGPASSGSVIEGVMRNARVIGFIGRLGSMGGCQAAAHIPVWDEIGLKGYPAGERLFWGQTAAAGVTDKNDGLGIRPSLGLSNLEFRPCAEGIPDVDVNRGRTLPFLGIAITG